MNPMRKSLTALPLDEETEAGAAAPGGSLYELPSIDTRYIRAALSGGNRLRERYRW